MRNRIAWAAACLIAATAAIAGTNEWTRTGPPGATIYSVKYVNGGGTALAINTRHIYRTTDHGASWTRVQSNAFGHMPLLAVNPVNGNQAVAVLDTIYRSGDGGATWAAVANSGVPVVVNGTHPQSIAWTRDGSAVWIGDTSGAVYRSTDAGANWTLRSAGNATGTNTVDKIEVDAVDPNRVYALTDYAIYQTANGGDSWTSLPNIFVSWAPSRAEAGVVLATVDADGTVVRSINYGASYLPRSTEEPGQISFAPGQANTAYGFQFTGEVSVSVDQGASWTARTLVPDMLALDVAISPTDANRILVVTQTGIYGSSDGGVTWLPRKQGMNERPMADLHSRVLPAGGGQVFVEDSGIESIFQRETNGQWVAIPASPYPLLGRPARVTGFAAAPSDGTLYLGQGGHFGASTNSGANWQRRGGFDIAGTLAVDPANSQILYAADSFRAGKSIDGGAHWTPLDMSNNLPEGAIQFAVNSVAANKLYALVKGNFMNSFAPLHVSNDSGVTWNPTPWLPMYFNFTANVMAYETGTTDTIYVGLEEGLVRTADAGANWTRLDPYPQTATPDAISSIALDPRTTGILYVTTRYAYPAMRSVDNGQTWEPLRAADATETNLVEKVIVDPTDSSRIVGLVTYGGMVEINIAPNLAITSTGTLTAGSSGSTSITVTNSGEYTATRVRLTGTLPAASGGYAVQPNAGLTCGVTGTALLCEAPLLRPAAALTATLTFTPTAAGQLQASVEAREPDSMTTNNTLNLTVAAAPPPPPVGGGSAAGGGGGGGGRLDYLLLALLGFATTINGVRRRPRQIQTQASSSRSR